MKTYLPLILLCLTCAVALPACTAQPAQKAQTADMEARLDALERNLDRICSILEERNEESVVKIFNDLMRNSHDFPKIVIKPIENEQIIIIDKGDARGNRPHENERPHILRDVRRDVMLRRPNDLDPDNNVRGRPHIEEYPKDRPYIKEYPHELRDRELSREWEALCKYDLPPQMRERLERIKSRLRPAQRRELEMILRYIALTVRIEEKIQYDPKPVRDARSARARRTAKNASTNAGRSAPSCARSIPSCANCTSG